MLNERLLKSVLSPTLRVKFCTCKYETMAVFFIVSRSVI